MIAISQLSPYSLSSSSHPNQRLSPYCSYCLHSVNESFSYGMLSWIAGASSRCISLGSRKGSWSSIHGFDSRYPHRLSMAWHGALRICDKHGYCIMMVCILLTMAVSETYGKSSSKIASSRRTETPTIATETGGCLSP